VIFRRPVATVKLDRRDSERPRYLRSDRCGRGSPGMRTPESALGDRGIRKWSSHFAVRVGLL